MSTRPTAKAKLPESFIRLPDTPEEPEDMNNYKYFNRLGHALHLVRHLGNEATTLVGSEAYISSEPTSSRLGLVEPDLFIAFNVDPDKYDARNGYVISEQGKPPDFVLEIGSESTGRRDSTVKRDAYARLGVLEYWRFDHSGGRFHGAPLLGERLVEGRYEPIPIERIRCRHLARVQRRSQPLPALGTGRTGMVRPRDREPHPDLRRPAGAC